MAIRVSIIEDDPRIRQNLAAWLEAAPNIVFVQAYSSAEAALEKLPQHPVDVVLTDINLPGIDGIKAVRQLKPLLHNTNFVMVTVYLDAEKLFEALSAGATGYLLKRTNREEVIRAIKEVHSGGSPMSSSIARFVVDAFRRASVKESELEQLSTREADVLERLARGRRYKEIADELAVSYHTVHTLIRRIYDKLHVHTRRQAIERFQQSGLARAHKAQGEL